LSGRRGKWGASGRGGVKGGEKGGGCSVPAG